MLISQIRFDVLEENIIFNLKNFKSKILPTITVCGSALFLMHGKVSADQIDTTNQKQTDAQVQTMGTTGASNNNNNDNQSSESANAANSNAVDTTVSQASTSTAHAAISTAAASSNSATSAASQQNTSSYDQNDQGNYAYLDSVKVND